MRADGSVAKAIPYGFTGDLEYYVEHYRLVVVHEGVARDEYSHTTPV